jgi:hypothetical protein
MPKFNQSHSGTGDNVHGNKVLNLGFPKLLVIGIIIILIVITFIYWKSIKERFFFDADKIDVALSITDSLQIVGLNEDESIIYTTDELVYYDLHKKGDTTEIVPVSSYLNRFVRNEELPGRGVEWVQLYSKIPNINFKVTNNSNKTIYFSKIEINVTSSEIDPEPIPTFNVGECFIGESNETLSFQIYNEGWSPIKNVKLRLNVIAPHEEVDYANTPYSMTYPVIEKEQLVDIFPILRKQGVDVDRLISSTEDREENVYMDTALVKTGLGKYVTDTSVIPGSRDEIQGIVYGWVMYDDVKERQYKLKIKMPIVIYREWGCGAAGVESGTYDVALCENGKDYKIVYPISQYIKATDIDNFSIRLICPKSSIHKMNVKLYYANDRYIEKYLNYHLIVPRRMVEEDVIKFKGNGKCTNTDPVASNGN